MLKKMGDYIDWSARECDASCAAQVIQSSIEVAESAQMATNYVGEALLALESVRTMIEEMHTVSDNTESQIIQLRIDTQKISDDIIYLTNTINSSVPMVDDNLLELITIILIAFTICIVSCLFIIGYSNFLEYRVNRRITPK